MKVRIDGGPTLTLRREQFVAAGGQGKVFADGNVAIKIHDDPNVALTPTQLDTLRRIRHPRLVVPDAVVRRAGDGTVVGHTMRFLSDARPVAQLVPTAFWRRESWDMPQALRLVASIAEAIAAVHAAGAAIVDLNDTNVVVTAPDFEPALIDADSWQFSGRPATAASPAYADPIAARPDAASDWFSFAVLAFELLCGMHPFKGKHPTLRGLSARMKAGVSVFDPNVRRPAACRPLDAVPADLRAWLQATLAHQRRQAPPAIRVHASPASPSPARAGMSFARDLTATLEHGRVRLAGPGPIAPSVLPVDAKAITVVDDALFVLAAGQLLCVQVLAMGTRRIATMRLVASVLPHASQLWPGVLVQDVLGVPHVTVLGADVAIGRSLPQLSGATIVDARYDAPNLTIVARQGTDPRRVTVTIDPSLAPSADGRDGGPNPDPISAAHRKRSVRTSRGGRKGLSRAGNGA